MTIEVHTTRMPSGEPVNWINASGVEIDLRGDDHMREVAAQLETWVRDTRKSNNASLFNKQAYVAPDNPYEQIKIARRAVQNDDVVGGLADTTEGLIFQGVQWESPESEEADIFNQMAARLNLDALLREAYRTLFTDSQVVFASWWDFQEFRVRGRNTQKVTENGQVTVKRGPRRRKTYTVYAPSRVTVLDSTKVVPIGNRMWGYDRLAWQAGGDEVDAYNQLMTLDPGADQTMARLFIGQYFPDRVEAGELAAMGVDPRYLLEFNPQYVWRHTLTKASHEPFPDIRLKSVFKLLDLKQQLMEADRVNLIGAANYILLVKKGTPEAPAHPEELANLRENFDVIARLPVIISDHRLNIEIITPRQDLVLQGDKYDTIDKRILARLVGALTMPSSGRGGETSITVSRGVGRLLENRRHMLKRSFEERIARAVVDHPANAAVTGQGFQSEPNLAFTPRSVQLDTDNQIAQLILALRTQKELSRKSLLEYFNFDQEVEAQRREVEEEQYDPIFKTQIPFSSPAQQEPVAPQITGAQGGRPDGGGDPPQNAANPQPRNRTPRQSAKAEDSQQ